MKLYKKIWKNTFFLLALLCLLFFYGTRVNASITESDVNFYWDMDSRTWNGSISKYDYYDYIQDSSLPLHAYSSTTQDTAKFGDYSLGTLTSNWAYLTNDEVRKTTGEWAYSFWIKTTSTASYQNIINIGSDAFLRLELRNGTDINFTKNTTTGWCDETISSVMSADGNFHHILIQGTWGSIESDFELWVDGTKKQTGLSDTDCDSAHNGTGNNMNIGSNGSSNYFTGSIDEAIFFDRKLTSTEIGELQTNSLADILNPPASATIYWAGVGTQYGQIGGEWDIPFYWNVCSSYEDINELYAYSDNIDGIGNPSKYYLINDKTVFTGPQLCSGIAHLTGSVSATSADTGTSTIWLATDTNSEYAESEAFNWSITSSGGSDNFLDFGWNNPLYIEATSTATTTLNFSYDFTDMSYSGGEVCLYNENSLKKTDYCSSITSDTGTETIDIANPSSDYVLNGSLVLYNASSTKLLKSEKFMIAWYSKIPIIELDDVFGVSIHDMVCDDNQWNATSTYAGLNFTVLKCQTFESALNIAEKIANIPKNIAKGFISVIKTTFPFNLPVKIYESWNNSENGTLPTELNWINPSDEDGNIRFTLPSAWYSGTTTILLWGDDLFSPTGQPQTTVFANIRILSKYLLWALFIFSIIVWGKRLVSDDEDETEFELEDVNLNNKGSESYHYRRKN